MSKYKKRTSFIDVDLGPDLGQQFNAMLDFYGVKPSEMFHVMTQEFIKSATGEAPAWQSEEYRALVWEVIKVEKKTRLLSLPG